MNLSPNNRNLIEKLANEIRNATINMKNISQREDAVKEILNKFEYSHFRSDFVGEVPAKGANGSFTEMKNRVRIQYRCGYGKWNYAPCIEVVA